MFNFVSVTSAFLGCLIAVAAVICFKHIHAAYENKKNQKKIERMKEAARAEPVRIQLREPRPEVMAAPKGLQKALTDAARGKKLYEVLEIPPKPGALQSGQKVESSTRGRGVVVGFSSVSSEPLVYFYKSELVFGVGSETLTPVQS